MTATSATATAARSLSSSGGWVSSYTNPQDPSDVSSPAYTAYRMAELIAIGEGASSLLEPLRLIIQEYTRSHYSFMPQEANDEAAKRMLARAYQIEPRKEEALQRSGLRPPGNGFSLMSYFRDCVAILGNTYAIAKPTPTLGIYGDIELGSYSDPQSKKTHPVESPPIYVDLLNESTVFYLTSTSFVRIHLGDKVSVISYPLKSVYHGHGLLNLQKDRCYCYVTSEMAYASYDPHSDAFEKRASFGAFPRGYLAKFLLTDDDTVITIQTNFSRVPGGKETLCTAFQVRKRDKGEDEVIEVAHFFRTGLKPFYHAHLVNPGEIALSTAYLQKHEMTSDSSLEGSVLKFGPSVSKKIQVESAIELEAGVPSSKAPAFVTQELLNLVDGLMKNEAVKKDDSLLKALQEKHAEIEHVYPSRDLSNANAVFFNLASTLLDDKGAIKKDIREQLLKKD